MAFPDVYAPGMLRAFWNSTNLTTTFDNVAMSITNCIRTSSSDRRPPSRNDTDLVNLCACQVGVLDISFRSAYNGDRTCAMQNCRVYEAEYDGLEGWGIADAVSWVPMTRLRKRS
jgi:hypothetical protein